MGKRWKKALKIISIFFAFIAIAFIALVIFVATLPQGPPFDDSELAYKLPNVPDSENGYAMLLNAAGMVGPSTESDTSFFKDIYPIIENNKKLRNLSFSDIRRFEAKYGKRLKEFEKSTSFKTFFSINYTYDGKRKPDKFINMVGARNLSYLEAAFAWHDFRNGNINEGMERLDTLLRLGQLLQNSYGTILAFILGANIQSIALEEINELLNQNLIPENQLLRLSGVIRKNNRATQGIKRTCSGEYFEMKERYEMWRSETGFFEKYLYREEKLKHLFDFYTTYFRWAGQPYSRIPDKKLIFKPSILEMILSFLSGEPVSELIYEYSTDFHFPLFDKVPLMETESNETELRIALLMYQSSNKKLPETLDALVPEYIPAVPRDPFDGKPLRYNPNKKIVYSVGYNLKDDGGNAEKDIFTIDRPKSKMNKDLVLHLMKTK